MRPAGRHVGVVGIRSAQQQGILFLRRPRRLHRWLSSFPESLASFVESIWADV